jgi:hypothetical protein
MTYILSCDFFLYLNKKVRCNARVQSYIIKSADIITAPFTYKKSQIKDEKSNTSLGHTFVCIKPKTHQHSHDKKKLEV